MKFSPALQAQFENAIESKVRALAISKSSGLAEYTSELKRRGVDISYTIAMRGDFDEKTLTDQDIDKIMDLAIDAIYAELDGIQVSVADGTKLTSKRGYKKHGKVKGVGGSQGIRDRKGRFLGGLKLANLLNILIKQEAADIMKNRTHGNTLNFRTGRLANSGRITSLNTNTGSIYFQYQMAPYSVFEKGGKKHKPGRDPRNIFGNAIAEALSKLLSQKDIKSGIFKIYHGRSNYGTIRNGGFNER